MDNEELVRILDNDNLLSVVELLSRALMCPDDDFEDLESGIHFLPDEVFNYCKDLSDYQRLKLMQLVVNTLVAEAERPSIENAQLVLAV